MYFETLQFFSKIKIIKIIMEFTVIKNRNIS